MIKHKLAFALLLLHFCLLEDFVLQLRARWFRYGGWVAYSWAPDSLQLRDEVFKQAKGHFVRFKSTKVID